MDVITTKILVAMLFGVIRFVLGVLPIKAYFISKTKADKDNLKSVIDDQKYATLRFMMSLAQSFGTGVLFATCFLRMIPEAQQMLQLLESEKTFYPVSQLIISLGFFGTYFIEDILQWFILRENKGTSVDTKNENISSKKAISSSNREYLNDNRKIIDKEKNGDDVSVKTIIDNMDKEVQTENESSVVLDSSCKVVFKQSLETELQISRNLIMVVALSVDAVWEGILIGLQTSVSSIWYLFGAVSVHSASIVFCVTLEVLLVESNGRIATMQLLLLTGTTTFGILLGIILCSESKEEVVIKSWTIMVFEGFSSGAVLYVTFFEALQREKTRQCKRALQALCIITGFTLIALLECLKLKD
ncbi:hypothetical protein ILUMI_25495 [Ignelater luminosus]|uniref:Uncharacterized protein n=1 Tax=Ignelater luminosus TaxID=2038154 RepID=A0A8K0C8F3_IGNLU|nr:hypothetical protein ILUMI_25495 [Ignelater luminosus]